MMRVKLDQESLGLSSLIERRTGALVKDCFQDEDLVYVIVSPGEMGKVIGKGGAHLRRLQEELHKKVKVVEFHENPREFIRRCIYPATVQEIQEQDEGWVLRDRSPKTKGLLIGRGGKNLNFLNRAVQRFFGKEVKVA